MLWLRLPQVSLLVTQKISMYLFLFLAEPGRLVCIFVSKFIFERKRFRRRLWWLFVATAVIDASTISFYLIRYPSHAEITGHHILYVQDFPTSLCMMSFILSAIATLLPSLFSHIRYMWRLGIPVAVSHVI